MANESTDTPIRLDHLDGVRGLAAFTVFVAHCMAMLPLGGLEPLLAHLAEKTKWLAVPAVDVFFVLSGFCLMYSLERKTLNTLSVLQFVVKRVLRIYPTYWAALFFALAARWLLYRSGSLTSMSEWFRSFWSSQMTWSDLVDHLMLIFSLESSTLNSVLWTLSVEMRMSLLFPIIAWMLRTSSGVRARLVLLTVCLLIVIVRIDYLSYLPLFAMGAALTRYRGTLLEWMPRSLTLSLVMLLIAGAVVVLIRTTVYPGIMQQARVIHVVIGLFSAYLILLATVSKGLSDFLRRAPVLFLGHISYSFYLVHVPVLLAAALVLPSHSPMVAVWGSSLLAAIVLSWASYRYIEVPTQGFGRYLSDRMKTLAAGYQAAC